MTVTTAATAPTRNARLARWVADWTRILEPRDVHWCDGSQAEYDALCAELVRAGTFVRLADSRRPRS